jgi:hypothetical protein
MTHRFVWHVIIKLFFRLLHIHGRLLKMFCGVASFGLNAHGACCAEYHKKNTAISFVRPF